MIGVVAEDPVVTTTDEGAEEETDTGAEGAVNGMPESVERDDEDVLLELRE